MNSQLNQNNARIEGKYLVLASPSIGSISQLQLVPLRAGADAAATSFGFPPDRRYQGSNARPAMFAGTVDLSEGANRRCNRFLKLKVLKLKVLKLKVLKLKVGSDP